MNFPNLVTKAFQFASEEHKNQLDDSGLPYFSTHVAKVAEIIKLVSDDSDVIAAAYLHDVVEDCGVTYQILTSEFNIRIADLVMEVTHEGVKDVYGYYFPRLQTQEGIMIKFADRLSNLSRMESWDEKRQAHYLKNSKFWKDKKTKG